MPSNGFISRARQVVLDNLLNPQFGVSSLADELGISRSELYRRIKEAEQKSASQFIREIRLERSLELLKTDQYSITEIAYMVGFNSPTYFSTCFKEYFGYSPSTAEQNGHYKGAGAKASGPGRWKVPIILGVFAILLAVLGISKLARNPNPEVEKSLAVLKFDYLGTDTTQSYMAYALSDEVLNSLSNHSGLKVVPSSSSFHVDKSTDCSHIGEQLGANYLVDGSLSEAGDQLRVTVKLIDAREGEQVWARSFESLPGAFPELCSGISEDVFAHLGLLGPMPTRSKNSLEATKWYLKAVQKGKVRYEDSIKQAIDWLERAVDLDPLFAEAYGELSFLYGQWHYYGSLNREERDKMMHRYMEKALQINPESPEVIFAKADFDYQHGRLPNDSSGIISGFRRVLELDPENHRSSYRLYQVLRAIGKYAAAHSYLENAWRLDPQNFLYNNVYARDLFWKWNEREKAFGIILKEAAKKNPSMGSIYFKALMLADQPGGDYFSAFRVINEGLKQQPYSFGFMYWGRLLALDLDLVPLARKYAHGNEVKFPDNPIYTYEPAFQICLVEKRYTDALDLTNIWLEDKGLDKNLGYSNLARVYFLRGDFQKSEEILLQHFSGLYNGIEAGTIGIESVQLSDLQPITNYIETLRKLGEHKKASRFADFLCSYKQAHFHRHSWRARYFPLDCYYVQNDVTGFVRAADSAFFNRGHRLAIYSGLRSLRYAAFEENPKYQKLFNRIEKETHRMRAEVIDYLKESGDWDPAWDAALD